MHHLWNGDPCAPPQLLSNRSDPYNTQQALPPCPTVPNDEEHSRSPLENLCWCKWSKSSNEFPSARAGTKNMKQTYANYCKLNQTTRNCLPKKRHEHTWTNKYHQIPTDTWIMNQIIMITDPTDPNCLDSVQSMQPSSGLRKYWWFDIRSLWLRNIQRPTQQTVKAEFMF